MRRLTTLVSLVIVVLLGLAAVPASADVELLPTDTDVDYQLGGEDDVPDNVGIVARDRTARSVDGIYNICYVNGYQTQPNQKWFWRQHWNLVLKRKNGKPVVDENWGEWLLDIRTPAKRKKLAAIVGRWAAKCADDGFQAVEFDNFDSFTRSKGLLKRQQALAFARLLTKSSHAADLAVGQKNLAGFNGRSVGFDYVVSESCAQYDECDAYVDDFGDQVVMIEYRRADFEEACDQYGDTHAIVLRDHALRPSYEPEFC